MYAFTVFFYLSVSSKFLPILYFLPFFFRLLFHHFSKNSQQLFFSFSKNCTSDDFHDKETARVSPTDAHAGATTTQPTNAKKKKQQPHVVVHPSLFGLDPARFPSESERSESRPDAPYLPPEPPRQGDSQSISAAEALTAR